MNTAEVIWSFLNMIWNGFCYCSNYHSTNLHQEISISCHGVNGVCI